MDSLTSGVGLSDSVTCLWILFHYLDYLVGPQWKRMCLVLLGLNIYQSGVVPKEGFLFSKGTEGYVKVGLEREEHYDCHQDTK